MADLTIYRLNKNNGPTPEDDLAPQIITDCRDSTLDFKKLAFVTSSALPPDSRTLISK